MKNKVPYYGKPVDPDVPQDYLNVDANDIDLVDDDENTDLPPGEYDEYDHSFYERYA